MSSLWDVSVIGKGKKWIDLEVVQAHTDAGNFPEDPVFALALLTSQAYKFGENYNRIPASPLGEKIPFDNSYLCDSLKGIVSEFIEKVVVYEVKNVPFPVAHEKVDQQVIAMGISKEHEGWNDAWGEKWDAFWNSKENIPPAKYRIWVTDERWIEHMEIGKCFDTASYSEDGPWVEGDRAIVLDDE